MYIFVALSVHLFVYLASGHGHTAYSHDSDIGGGDKANWMSSMYDGKRLSVFSLAGTHDTMSRYGGDTTECQSLTLTKQLDAGVRVLDIRCRHISNSFSIHHGIVYQNTMFGDVMNELTGWLSSHPTEAVLARIKLDEHDETGCTRSKEATFEEYYQRYSSYIWSGFDQSGWAPIPTLGEVRGKIVILQNFGSSAKKYGLPWSEDNSWFDIQDDFSFSTNWYLDNKWESVKAKVYEARSKKSRNRFHINFLTGSGGSFPYFVASGHSNPSSGAPRLATGKTTPGWSAGDFPKVNCFIGICTIAFEGTNILFYQWFASPNYDFVGIVMIDFPGKGLLDAIIAKNDQYKDRMGLDISSMSCPSGYSASGADNCCSASWSSSCGESCAQSTCTSDSDWYWDAYDYSANSYTCCAYGAACPSNYDSNNGECCFASWTASLGQSQRQSSCNANADFVWIPLDYNSNPYTCCHRREVSFGDVVSGEIAPRKKDYYEVVLTETEPMLYFEACGSSYDSYLYFYDANMNAVSSCDDCNIYGRSCGTQGDLVISNVGAGTYFLGIGGYSTSSGAYKVSMSNGVIGCGQTVTQSISSYKKDILRIDLASDYAQVYWEACDSQFDTYLFLYGENGDDGSVPIVECDDCNNHGASCTNGATRGDLTNNDMTAGIYYLGVGGYRSASGTYTVQMVCTNTPAAKNNAPDLVDEHYFDYEYAAKHTDYFHYVALVIAALILANVALFACHCYRQCARSEQRHYVTLSMDTDTDIERVRCV